MRGMPFQLQGNDGGLDFPATGFPAVCSSSQQESWKQQQLLYEEEEEEEKVHSFGSTEPTSVLHMRMSLSPPTSASTLSSSFGGAGEKASSEWANELQPIPAGLEIVSSRWLEDWENMLSEEPAQEQSLMRWISDDDDDGLKHLLQSNTNPMDFDGGGGGGGLGIVEQGNGFDSIGGIGIGAGVVSDIRPNFGAFSGSGFVIDGGGGGGANRSDDDGSSSLVSPPSGLVHFKPNNDLHHHHRYPQQEEAKPRFLNPTTNHHHNHQAPSFFPPLENHHHLLPLPKRQNSGRGMPFSDPPGHHELLLRNQPQQQQQQDELLDQLYKAAEMAATGNFNHAQGILARLNQHQQQQQLSPIIGKPLHRAAFYFKEALQLSLDETSHPRTPTPFDVIFKMGAYKLFSEVSPLIQFTNFTCNQALMESLEDAERIHIVDFDIGFGAQWASFMQELLPRNRGSIAQPSLKITAFASPDTHHPIELGLMRENLTQFANEIGISFELDVINFDSLDLQGCYSLPVHRAKEDEAVVVNFPIWAAARQPSALPSLLRLIKQLNPKIAVSLDRGCDRSDLSFPQHLLHALQSYVNLLESLDAANVTGDALNKIERFLLQPSIESTLLGRLRGLDKTIMTPHWKTMFASSGFSPLPFSNFTETQAECVLKRAQGRGFHVEKRHACLVLYWQGRELVSASAWRC